MVSIVATPLQTSGQLATRTSDARSQFVGAWRLVSVEHTAPDGTLEKPQCRGQFLFTPDGHAAVQVMYQNTDRQQTTAYAQGGYEATFGRYSVDQAARTFTFHVDGALVRTLVGTDLRRAYTFTGNQLIVEPANTQERWRVVWARE